MYITKRLALYPEARSEVCHHMHFAWSGNVPCTGRLLCVMCGYDPYEIAQIEEGIRCLSHVH